MKKEKPAVINELSLNEFILVFKYSHILFEFCEYV